MSKVYFAKDTARAAELFDVAGFKDLFKPNDSAALKIHFGEPGNKAFLKPELVKPLCEKVKACGAKPFYTDCNVLYKGPRDNSKGHYETAKEHGYTEENAGAPVILSDEDIVYRIIGVFKDYNTVSLHYNINPMILLNSNNHISEINIRLSTADLSSTIAAINKKWNDITGGYPFDYFFLDSYFKSSIPV